MLETNDLFKIATRNTVAYQQIGRWARSPTDIEKGVGN